MKSHRYLPITQQPYCCVPASLQMVLWRRKLPLLAQEEIGSSLGLNVPSEEHFLLPEAFCDERPAAGWGTRVGRPEYSIQQFFDRYSYELHEEYFDVEHLPVDLRSWFAVQLENDNDVLACLNADDLLDGGDNGHVLVVDSVGIGETTLVDPAFRAPKYRTVPTDRFFKAITHHGTANRAGLWVISATGNQ